MKAMGDTMTVTGDTTMATGGTTTAMGSTMTATGSMTMGGTTTGSMMKVMGDLVLLSS
jgi:hypothetical protein